MTVSNDTGSYGVLLLGPLVVSRDGVRLDTEAWPRRSQAVLKLLITAPEHRRSRDDLIDLLWPDAAPETGMSNLRWAVHQLRRGLGARDTILVEQGWLSLNRCYRWDSDFHRFTALLDAGAQGAAMEQALELVRGEPLAEDRYEDWSAPIRTAIEQRWQEGCLRMASLHRAQRTPELALQWYERLLQQDPLHEESIQGQLEVYRQLGRRKDGLTTYEHFRERLWEELGMEPAAETMALAARLSERANTPAHNLPAPLTSFVGRVSELDRVGALLRQEDIRILSITGPGGTGKTRLALEIAARVLNDFPDGVSFVSLAPLVDPKHVQSRIAQVLGIQEVTGQSVVETVKEQLRAKAMLLLLDNFEQVLPAGSMVSDLLVACPKLTVLVTSRECLHLYGEQRYALSPLALPAVDTSLEMSVTVQSDAVVLFVKRASTSDVNFALTADNAGLVTQLCRRLEGLPLSIELAAVQVADRPLQLLVDQLEDRLKLLTAAHSNMPVRHRSLRAVLDWSYDLLDHRQQAILRQLAVLVGRWSVDEARGMCMNDADSIGDTLRALVDKSLLLDIDGRFSMLETIREYAVERLEESGEGERVRRRHAEYFLTLAERSTHHIVGSDSDSWLRRLEEAHDDLRVALRWLLDGGDAEKGLRLAVALAQFWEVRGYLRDGLAWMEEALERAPSAPAVVRAAALNGVGKLAYFQAAYDRAKSYGEAGLRLSRGLDDWRGVASSLITLAAVAMFEGDEARSESLLLESLDLYTSVNDRQGMAAALSYLGLRAIQHGDYEGAKPRIEECLALSRELNDRWVIADCLDNLGLVAVQQGEYERARPYLEESLALYRDLGDSRGTAMALNILGLAAMNQRDLEKAEGLFEESLTHYDDLGNGRGHALLLNNLGMVALYLGNQELARNRLEESLTLYRQLKGVWGTAVATNSLGMLALATGDVEQAHVLQAESLSLFGSLGDKAGVCGAIEEMALILAAQGKASKAMRLWGALEGQRATLGAPLPPIEQVRHNHYVSKAQEMLDVAQCDASWKAGHDMTLEDAVQYAVDTYDASD